MATASKARPGRPTKLTPQVVTKLVAAFAMGYSDTEAAAYSGISRKTFYEWLQIHPEFRNKMRGAKSEPNMKAKEVLVNAINNGNINAAKWWLEHKAADEFNTKPDNNFKVPAELQDFIRTLQDILATQELRIAFRYRDYIYRVRENERAEHAKKAGTAVKPGFKDEVLTRLLSLSDAELTDHIIQEIASTGQDLAEVRDLVEQRQEIEVHLRREMDKARHWYD